MKKFICLTLCLLFLLTVGCKNNTNNNTNDNTNNNAPTTTKSGKLSDKVEFKIYDNKSKIWLDNSHIEEISLKSENGEKSLIITATEEGKELLKNACEANLGKPLTASADKRILYSALVVEPIKSGMLLINNKTTDYNYLYNYLTDAKDKMAGVTPPNTLISEEDAKKIVFDYAKITADEATDIKINLEITEEYFGWKYCIDLNYNGLNHNVDINAYTGSIIRFHTDFT